MNRAVLVLAYIIFVLVVIGVVSFVVWRFYKKGRQEAKNYERGLKMVRLHISLPPSSTDLDTGGRDQRDVTDEAISQAQVMYNIIASTATKGFKSKLHGQRHISFELISNEGLVQYYVVTPVSLVDVIKQSVTTAYPSAILQETRGDNIFSEVGKVTGTIGGEFSLKKDFFYPIATYQDNKQDSSRSILNALSAAKGGDGVAIQILLRPASSNWVDNAKSHIKQMKKEKESGGKGVSFLFSPGELLEALWKPPEVTESKDEPKINQLTNLEQEEISAIEEKTRYPGFETLIRLVVSSNTLARSQTLLQGITASFSVFDRAQYNGLEFNYTQDVDALVTAYVMRFFPQSMKNNILNSIELASIFHLPSQKDIPTSQVVRQATKQVDGPTDLMTEGILIGVNEYRGVKKPIRLSTNDRRRHMYFIGQTGTGKSGLLENLAYQDMLAGRGFAFIDPHGDSVEKILGMVPRERVEDVIYFNPSDVERPIGLNLFEFENHDQKDFLIQEGIQMLYRLYDPGHTGIVGPRFEHWFRNAALTIMSDPSGSTFIDIPQVFNDQAFADYKLKFVQDQTVLDFWNKEMAQTTESSKSDVLGWFASKFGAFLSNEMMRNILGQTKSGFDIKDIMNEEKILLVNLSKGKTGELNSMLLGMIFVMKFQVAAMSRASIPEDQRKDFCLYVDEFQNFATDSFESILSEARKYRLNIIVANQFMTQLTDKIREAIIGNVGTMIAGRVGVTDAELLVKKFSPTFDAEDLTKLPNYQTIASVLINNVPSAPFSMNLIPPMGTSDARLRDAVKQLSRTNYGQDRHVVDREIKQRLSVGDWQRSVANRANITQEMQQLSSEKNKGFLDDWLERRKQLGASPSKQSNKVVKKATSTVDKNTTKQGRSSIKHNKIITSADPPAKAAQLQKTVSPGEINFRSGSGDDAVAVDLRRSN
ncbi:MAG: type IV secretory system conjugative DNA transfer family protein [Candidatus Nanosyncoccaceae bacterium]|jgi:hypothetical protein